MRDCVSSVATPVKQLKAFSKVGLKSGQKICQRLKVAVADLGFTDENGVYKIEPGAFELMLGDASDNILLRDTITIGDAANDITEKSTAEHVAIERYCTRYAGNFDARRGDLFYIIEKICRNNQCQRGIYIECSV